MVFSFDDACRGEIARCCAAFARVPASEATRGLKPAAVAIALVATQRPSGATAFLLTRRASGLRSHRGQWALPGGRCDEGETPVVIVTDEAVRSKTVTDTPDDGTGADDLPFGGRGKRLVSRKEREAAKAAGLPVPD